MKNFIIIVLLSWILITVSKPPMNYSFDDLTVSQVVDLLINSSSSNFPAASLLNYVLFGSTNDGFNYSEYLSAYGYNVSKPDIGDIIIGKDGQLGGIFDYNYTYVIPVPNGRIQQVKPSSLSKYFPKGYEIKSSILGDYTNIAYSGNMIGRLQNVTVCDECEVQVWNYKQVPNFVSQSVFWFHQVESAETFIDMFGYFQSDSQNRIGTMRVSFVKTNFEDETGTYKLVDPNYRNTIFYAVDQKGCLAFNGTIEIVLRNQTQMYSFAGKMNPNRYVTLLANN